MKRSQWLFLLSTMRSDTVHTTSVGMFFCPQGRRTIRRVICTWNCIAAMNHMLYRALAAATACPDRLSPGAPLAIVRQNKATARDVGQCIRRPIGQANAVRRSELWGCRCFSPASGKSFPEVRGLLIPVWEIYVHTTAFCLIRQDESLTLQLAC